MTRPRITFIGAGNMAKCIVGGLVTKGYPPNLITFCAPNLEKLKETASTFRTNFTDINSEGTKEADVVILSVKPGLIKNVCNEIAAEIDSTKLVISVAAGITCETMEAVFGEKQPIIRCMPNTPALVTQGATGMFANDNVSEEQRQIASLIIEAIGIQCWVETENLIDVVTSVSGSGPAYYFLIMEAMIDAAQKQGLDKDTATKLTLQTALGAAILAGKSDLDVAQLRKNVTSPNGTTEQAIKSFEEDNLRGSFLKAMKKAECRSKELAKEFK